MLDDRLKRLIERELKELNSLLEQSGEMLEVTPGEEPTFERRAALSQVLISFYTGLERIFERVARRVDRSVPEGGRWHTELLHQIARATEDRPALISEETRVCLREYLAFRHRSVHAYAHHLQWPRMEHLVVQVLDVWDRGRADIHRFIGEYAMSQDGSEER